MTWGFPLGLALYVSVPSQDHHPWDKFPTHEPFAGHLTTKTKEVTIHKLFPIEHWEEWMGKKAVLAKKEKGLFGKLNKIHTQFYPSTIQAFQVLL